MQDNNQPLSLVIGGTRGLGLAVARHFAEGGQRVFVVGRTEPAEVLQGIQFVRADLSDPEMAAESIFAAVSQFGSLSKLVFAQRHRGTDESRADEDWEGEFRVSLSATKAILDRLRPCFSNPSAVVIVASNAARFVARDQPLSYHVGKAALVHLARWYAVQWGRQGIRVNVVSPCAFIKEESRNYYEEDSAPWRLYQQITPLGRMACAEDVANVVGFLCDARAAFVTGQEILVDGGMSLLLHDSLARELAETDTSERGLAGNHSLTSELAGERS